MKKQLPKLVFIGRAYHAKTKSDEIVLSLLRQHYDITIIRRDGLEDKVIVKQVNSLKPVAVLFWCLPPSFTFHLLKFRCKNIIWAPMWDGFKPLSMKKQLIFRLYNIKVLCFSQVLFDYFKKTPLRCTHMQCFLKPNEKTIEKKAGPYTFFFWQREKEINLDKIVEMVGEKNIQKIIYKSEIGDQKHQKYTFEIEKLESWLKKDEYYGKMDEADFFIAPRRSEGIGFSFLEPMSRGLVVLAYDNATMNEYIKDGENGYLFNDKFKLSSDLLSPVTLSKMLMKKNSEFYQNWIDQKDQLIPFIENKRGIL